MLKKIIKTDFTFQKKKCGFLWTNCIYRHSCIHFFICFELLLHLCTMEKLCHCPMLFLPFVQQNSYNGSSAAYLELFIFNSPSLGWKTLCLVLDIESSYTHACQSLCVLYITYRYAYLLSQRTQNSLPQESMRDREIRCCPDCHRIGKKH